jgi:hypothetical protein
MLLGSGGRALYAAVRCGSAFVLGSALSASAYAASVLDQADVRVRFESPVTCEVTEALTISLDTATVVDHRVQSFDGSAIQLLGISGADAQQPPVAAGRTEVLRVRFAPGTHAYTITYRVTQTEAWAFRCPTWLPVVPADGRSRNVRLAVDLPSGATPASNVFPALDWRGNRGAAVLGHLPSFVRVPYDAPGSPTPATLDMRRTMDLTAIALLVGGTGLWAWRRRS